MSARPAILQFLQHGKLLCGKVFGGFVETWNYLVEGFDNLKGDVDVDPKTGIATVDRSDPTHPIIRIRKDRIRALVKGSGAGGYPGPFEIGDGEIGAGCVQIGGYTVAVAGYGSVPSDGVIAVRVARNTFQGSLILYSSVAAMQAAQDDMEYFIHPVYQFASGEVTVDFRLMPDCGMLESMETA